MAVAGLPAAATVVGGAVVDADVDAVVDKTGAVFACDEPDCCEAGFITTR